RGRGCARDHDGAEIGGLSTDSAARGPWPCGLRTADCGVRTTVFRSLPHETDPEPHIALAAVLRACDHADAVQILNAAVGVQPQVRDVPTRVAEPGRVGDVERLEAELDRGLRAELNLAR